MKCSSVIAAWMMFIITYVDDVLDDSKEITRSTAEASLVAPVQWVNPLTKEQLQQAFIYLLQVLLLCILLMVNSVIAFVYSSQLTTYSCFNGYFPGKPGLAHSVFSLVTRTCTHTQLFCCSSGICPGPPG